MSIPAVVTGGFGNGVFSPGVEFVPTLGFSIGEFTATTTHAGIACLSATSLTQPTITATSLTQPTITETSLTQPTITPTILETC